MQVNPEYDLSKPLASAIKATAPYVGIPMPGHAPLILHRDRLAAALRGVKPVNIEVIQAENGERSLLVEGIAAPHIRTRMLMHSKRRGTYEVRTAMDRWADCERRKRVKAAGTVDCVGDRKTTARYRKIAEQIKRLERELSKLGGPVRLHNPAAPPSRDYERYSESHRASLKQIRATKRIRTIIGGIAAQARRDGWTNIRLYKELAAHGFNFTKLSAMTASVRERRGAATWFLYLKNLHCFCEGSGWTGYERWNPYRGEHARGDGQEWGGERYMAKLADTQTRRSLQEQINSLIVMRRQLVQEAV